VVMVYMTAHGVCSVPDSAVDTFAIDVYPDSVFPVITITTAGPDTISIIGETKTFYSSVTYAGTTPGYQWIVNGVPFPGATSSSFSLQVYANDTVYCQVTGTPLCPASVLVPGISNAIIINAAYLGVSNLSQGAANLSLFPNPNSGSFTLSGTVNNVQGQEVYYDVSNMLGQVVYRGTTVPQNGRVNEQITLGNVAGGTYLLRVNTDKGSETFHFVISK